jgi:hypothetical protein
MSNSRITYVRLWSWSFSSALSALRRVLITGVALAGRLLIATTHAACDDRSTTSSSARCFCSSSIVLCSRLCLAWHTAYRRFGG